MILDFEWPNNGFDTSARLTRSTHPWIHSPNSHSTAIIGELAQVEPVFSKKKNKSGGALASAFAWSNPRAD